MASLRLGTFKLVLQLIFLSFVSCQYLSYGFYGIVGKTLKNFVNWSFATKMPVESALHCFYICAVNRSCSGVFYQAMEKACVLCNQTFSDTSQLDSYPGMKYYRIHASSCSEAVMLGYTESGARRIDPDGLASEFSPAVVWCDLVTKPGTVITRLNHDHEARTYVEGYETCGSYNVNLTYTAGLEIAKLIADLSSECTQEIAYECFNSRMIDFQSEIQCAMWKGRDGTVSPYFTGNGSYGKYCDCRQMSSCSHRTGCWCDWNDKKWRQDKGNVTNKDDLPITELLLGDTGGSRMEWSHRATDKESILDLTSKYLNSNSMNHCYWSSLESRRRVFT